MGWYLITTLFSQPNGLIHCFSEDSSLQTKPLQKIFDSVFWRTRRPILYTLQTHSEVFSCDILRVLIYDIELEGFF